MAENHFFWKIVVKSITLSEKVNMILYVQHFRTIRQAILCPFGDLTGPAIACIHVHDRGQWSETRQKYIGYPKDWQSFFALIEKIPDSPKICFFADGFMI